MIRSKSSPKSRTQDKILPTEMKYDISPDRHTFSLFPNSGSTSEIPSSTSKSKIENFDPSTIRTRQGIVLYSFEPENPGELAVEADDIIEVITVKGEWIECFTNDRRHGWVPFNYVQIQEENTF
jgi:hypothetical protein